MRDYKEKKRIQFSIAELEQLEFHLGNEKEMYFEFIKDAETKGNYEEADEWKPYYYGVSDLYDKIATKHGLVGRHRWWFKEEETENK